MKTMKTINQKSLEAYLRYSYLGDGMSFFEESEDAKCDYIDFSADEQKPKAEYLAELESILNEIFESERKVSDSAFLSSGVDSSTIAFGIKAGKTFSVTYDDPVFDESAEARKTAEILGSEHHEVKIGPEDFFDAISDSMADRGLPTGDASYISLYIAARETAKWTDHVCSGEGPDELFCGYPCYNSYFREPSEDFYIKAATIIDVGSPGIGELSSYDGDGFLKMNAFDLTYWMKGNILKNVEKAAKAHKINIRTPYMNPKLVKFALSLPKEYKADKNSGKILFREAASKYVGDEIAFREKRGFPVPVRKWMRQDPWKRQILDLLTGSDMREVLSLADVNEILNSFYIDNDNSVWKQIWEMFVFGKWYMTL